VAGERLRGVLRRNLALTVAILLIGTLAANGASQLRGKVFAAESRVLFDTRDLAGALTGAQSAYVDPRQLQATRLELAGSESLFETAERRSGGEFGTAEELRRRVKAAGDTSDVIVFSARAQTPQAATGSVVAVAHAYVEFRDELRLKPVREAQAALRVRLRAEPNDSALRDKLATLEVLETLGAGDATVIDNGRDVVQVSPAPLRDTVVGLLAGTVVALLAVGTREALTGKIRTQDELGEVLGNDVAFGAVPLLPSARGPIPLAKPESRFAGAYRVLLAEIEARLRGVGHPVLAIASPQTGDGKSTTAVNLGLVAAQRGLRVLLVDADGHRGQASRQCGVPSGSTGMRDLSATFSTAEALEILWTVHLGGSGDSPVEATPVPVTPGGLPPGLYVVPAGRSRAPWNAYSDRVRRFVQEFDMTIVDGPPSAVTPDLAQLARVLDGVLIVVRKGGTFRSQLRRLVRQVEGWGGPKVTAAVLVGDRGRSGGGYYDQ